MRGWIIVAALLAAACGAPEPTPPAAVDEASARARTAAADLGGSLLARLTAELEAGGPAAAVHVCSEVAQAMAAERSDDTLSIRRVSLRARNPADEPDAFERDGLERLAAAHAAGELPPALAEVVGAADGSRRLRWLKPIVVAPPCLACHGPRESLAAEVAAAIAERYPDDTAVGYAAGDLRGAFSVTVALD